MHTKRALAREGGTGVKGGVEAKALVSKPCEAGCFKICNSCWLDDRNKGSGKGPDLRGDPLAAGGLPQHHAGVALIQRRHLRARASNQFMQLSKGLVKGLAGTEGLEK